MKRLLIAASYVLLAPLLAGLLAGLDRRMSARLQRRRGPPLWQPFYDMAKLCQKENLVLNQAGHLYLIGYLLFTVLSGALFFAGGDVLIVIFGLALAGVFLILGAFAACSPFSHIGAERELVLMMASEPMLILTAMGFYLGTRSFQVSAIYQHPDWLIFQLPGVFFGLLYVLTIKLRKSPFDLSTSHHAHQELVKGLTTEFSGPSLAMIELAHWYETILLLGFLFLFFAPQPLVAVAAILLVYAGEVMVDNASARVKWQWTLLSAWAVTAGAGALNLVVVYLLEHASA